jgi:hypothetical protein
MMRTIIDVIALGLGAASLLDLAIGWASGLLQLAHDERSLAPAAGVCRQTGTSSEARHQMVVMQGSLAEQAG